MAHSANADNRDAIFGYFNSMLHSHFGCDLSGGIIGMQYRRTGTIILRNVGSRLVPPLRNSFGNIQRVRP